MAYIKRTVKVNNRPYKLTVKNETEEIIVNRAVKLVNDKIQEFKSVIVGRDDEDILAMVAIELASIITAKDKDETFMKEELVRRLMLIDQQMEEVLSTD
ncbi:MAG: hypothetical protein CSA94_01235 [Bacteroidetes bacterium]|nr:MAG: hypothetical protein CSA94_01235 [Bacteroidota bacterium]